MAVEFIGCASGNFQAGRPQDHKPEAIVIHIAVGNLKSVDDHFRNPLSRVSAHYCIGKKGEIHQYVQEEDTAFHAGIVDTPVWPLIKQGVNPNYYTIGIEHEGMPDDVWPQAQLAASAALIADITERWYIPCDPLHIIMHRHIRASKTCPGSFITFERILSEISRLGCK